MRIGRAKVGGQPAWVIIEGETVYRLNGSPFESPSRGEKDGDVGATGYAGDRRIFEPALVVDVVEAVGAGDAFAGGYLASRLSGEDLDLRLRAGHGRAALTLRTTGDFVE